MKGKPLSVNNMSRLFMSSIKGNGVTEAPTASTLFGADTIQQSIKVKRKITDFSSIQIEKDNPNRDGTTAQPRYSI